MFRSFVGPMAALLILAGALLGCEAAFAAALSSDVLSAALTPSAAPALLGPITSAGRKSWDCRPEQAAKTIYAFFPGET